MAYCPHCREEYALEIERCPRCRRLLLPQKPAWRSFAPGEKLVTVRKAYGELETALYQGQLEQEGIPVVVRRESAGLVLGVTVNGLGAQHLQVPESLAEEAREVLAAFSAYPRLRRRRLCRFRRRGPILPGRPA
ncbi:MAG: hypothetical protein ACP5OO_08275 [Chloroflexia bacterium]